LKNKKTNRKSHEKPISLDPLSPEEALKALLSTPAPKREKAKKKSKK